MILNFLAPKNAAFESVEVDGEEVPLVQFLDEDSPVAWHVLEIPAGERATATATYTVPGAIDVVDGIARFRFKMVPQPLVRPDRYAVRVRPPQGFSFVDPLGAGDPATNVTERGILDSDVEVALELSRDG
jgi:hypothetical protein